MARKSSQDKPNTEVVEINPEEVQADPVEVLTERISQLEQAVCKLAVMSGHGNYLKEFGLKVWQPKREDMHRKVS